MVAEVEGEGFPVVMRARARRHVEHLPAADGGASRPIASSASTCPAAGRSPRAARGADRGMVRRRRRRGHAHARRRRGRISSAIRWARSSARDRGRRARPRRSLTLFGALAEPTEATRKGLGGACPARAQRGHGADRRADRGRRAVGLDHGVEPGGRSPSCARSLMRQNPEGYARTCEALARRHRRSTAADFRADAARHRRRRRGQSAERGGGARATGSRVRGSPSSTAAGHWLTVEKPAECNQRIADFLKRVEQCGQRLFACKRRPAGRGHPTGGIDGRRRRRYGSRWSANGREATASSSPMSACSMAPASIPIPAKCWSRATASSRSRAAARASAARRAGGGATVIDGMGATLMPGMIDAHLHLSWNNAPGIDPIQMMELEEHMLVTMEMAKLVLDAGFTGRAGRGCGEAAARRGHATNSSTRAASRPALHRGRAGDHHGRRPRRFSAPPHIPHRGPQPRPRRVRAGGGPPHRAHADQIRRRLDQAQPLRRGDHRHGGGGDADVGRGGRDGGAGGASAAARSSPPMPARRDRSSSASATASRTSTTPPSPTRRRSTCWRRPRTGISSRRASPG